MGENLINAKLGVPETMPLSKINIVTWGGKNIRDDFGAIEQPRIIKPTSPKHSYGFE